MKDFLKQNGILILIIALLLALITAVLSFLFGGIANPFANVAGVISTPFRNGIHAVVTWTEGLYSDAFRREEVEAELERYKQRVAELEKSIAAEEYRLKKAQESTAAYVRKLAKAHDEEMAFLSNLCDLVPPEQLMEPQSDPSTDIEAAVAAQVFAEEKKAEE